jgi:hypothetical protein
MPRVSNPSIGAGASDLLVSTVTLTSAQIKALSSSPIVTVPAPGAGNLINVLGVAARLNFGTHAYAALTDVLTFLYDNAAFDGVTNPSISGLVTNPQSGNAYTPGFVDPDSSNLTGNANSAIAVFGTNSYNVGPIVTATLGGGGAGYVANDTGTITNGANDATYKVLTVGAGGAVLTFQITGAGTTCSVANGNATVDGGAQPGVGAGFTVNITAVQTGDGTLKVVTYYQIIPVP